MTLPDLGKLWLKRSVHPVHYIYLFHSMNSTPYRLPTGAFDGFDTILVRRPAPCRRDPQDRSPSTTCPRSSWSSTGAPSSTRCWPSSTDVTDSPERAATSEILVAPTWGDSSLIERPVGRELD